MLGSKGAWRKSAAGGVGAALAAAGVLSCQGSKPAAGGGASADNPFGALAGTWDISQAGGSVLPSEAKLTGTTMTGSIIEAPEGKPDAAGCTRDKFRTEFSFTVQGKNLTGSLKTIRRFSGTKCPSNEESETLITGTRFRSAPTTDTDLNGDWEISAGKGAPFIVTFDGLTAQATDKAAKAQGSPPTVTASASGGILTVTSKKSSFQLAARKR